MRRIALVSAVVFLMIGAAVTPAQQTPFRTGVSLVTVDVTVLDKAGRPVPGLSAEDFEIKLGGNVQPVRAIAFLQAASPGDASAAKPAAPAAPVANAPPSTAPKPASMLVAKEVEVRRSISNQDNLTATTPVPSVTATPAASVAAGTPAQRLVGNIEPRTFVLLVDDLSFTTQRGKKIFFAAEKFVTSVPPSDPVGFTTTSGTATLNPTMDRRAVVVGLSKIVGQYTDPRMIDPSGNSFGGGHGNPREQPLGIGQSLEIERGNDAELRQAIVRECFAGNQSAISGQLTQSITAAGGCAGGIETEARRTAQLTRQTRSRQLDSMKAVVTAMQGTSGIRHLVILTDGIAVHTDVSDLQPFVRAAASAGVQVSVIMEDPESVSMDSPVNSNEDGGGSRARSDGGFAGRVREDNRLVLNGAQTVTDMIGGLFYRVVGDATPFFGRLLVASSALYRLGVELPSGAQPGKELSLGVNIKRAGLTVRANRLALNTSELAPAVAAPPAADAALAGKPNAPPMITGPVLASIDDVLKAALNENRSLRGVPIRLGATLRRSASVEGQIDVSVNVIFPASVKTPITTLVGLVDETNALRINRRVVDSTSQPVQFLFPVASGSYAIRFGAAGADGALGTIDLPIAAKLHAMGAFTTSDVLTYVVGDASQKTTLFAIDDVPAATEPSTYHASIELYPAGAMPSEPPVINWTIVRDGDTKAMVDEDSEGRVGKNLFRSDFEIPFASLPPGTYVVRATLIVADKPAGSVGAVIRKTS